MQLRCGGSVGGKGKLWKIMAVTVVVLVLLREERNSRNMAIKKRRWRYLRWQWRVTKKCKYTSVVSVVTLWMNVKEM